MVVCYLFQVLLHWPLRAISLKSTSMYLVTELKHFKWTIDISTLNKRRALYHIFKWETDRSVYTESQSTQEKCTNINMFIVLEYNLNSQIAFARTVHYDLSKKLDWRQPKTFVNTKIMPFKESVKYGIYFIKRAFIVRIIIRTYM